MSEVENLLHQLLDKMSEVASTLEEISDKLDNVSGAYGIDDVVAKLDEIAGDIVGPTRYNLTDLHGALSSIESEISSVNTTLMLKD